MSDKQNNCMDDFDPNSLLLDEALEKILELVDVIPAVQRVDIQDALDRITSEIVYAAINVPSFTSSAMDGYAVRFADIENKIKTFSLVGKSLAGHPYKGEVQSGECIRITTGATVPAGADTVIIQENTRINEGSVTVQGTVKSGQFARAPGTDTCKGDVLLAANKQLLPVDIALLASQGIASVGVRKRPRVACLSTGDELQQAGSALNPGHIYDSNRPLLAAMLKKLGVELFDAGVAIDSEESLQKTLDEAAKNADLIISSGGVSVGDADFVKPLLEKHGNLEFWKIAMKPGRPLLVGRYMNTPFFGLPGNPVSVAATFSQLVKPAIEKMCGVAPAHSITLNARTTSTLKKQAGRVEFQRGVLSQADNGEWVVETTGLQDSHVLSSLSQANCYIVLPLESTGADVGETVSVQLFDGSL